MKKTEYRDKIQELQRTLNEAYAQWEHDLNAGLVGHQDQSHCRKCGADESQRVTDYYTTFCPRCFPNTKALASEQRRLSAELERVEQDPRNQRAAAMREYRAQIKQEFKQFSPRFAASRFRSYFPRNESQAHAADQVAKWAGSKDAQDRIPFVLLYGNCGVGKTHLLMAARRRIAHKVCIPTFVNEVELSTTWQRAHDYKGRRPNEIIDEVRNASVLIIDDLGKVKPTEAWLRVLYEIINHRYEQRLPTLVSTNCDPAELVAAVGRATADRIIDNREHLILPVEGQSMRAAA